MKRIRSTGRRIALAALLSGLAAFAAKAEEEKAPPPVVLKRVYFEYNYLNVATQNAPSPEYSHWSRETAGVDLHLPYGFHAGVSAFHADSSGNGAEGPVPDHLDKTLNGIGTYVSRFVTPYLQLGTIFRYGNRTGNTTLNPGTPFADKVDENGNIFTVAPYATAYLPYGHFLFSLTPQFEWTYGSFDYSNNNNPPQAQRASRLINVAAKAQWFASPRWVLEAFAVSHNVVSQNLFLFDNGTSSNYATFGLGVAHIVLPHIQVYGRASTDAFDYRNSVWQGTLGIAYLF